MEKLRIGIFFGGQSREREVSFAGGRTVYDNLNKDIFEAVPVFVDSLGNFILLNWEYIYKGTIRDFYPPLEAARQLGFAKSPFQIYIESLGQLTEAQLDALISEVGKRIYPQDFQQYFDFAFLALHGSYGEDGNIQGLMEWYNIPYSGSGILPSAIGVNKIIQSDLLKKAGFQRPKQYVLTKKRWLQERGTQAENTLFSEILHEVGLPVVVKSPNQGSSIGVSILKSSEGLAEAIDKSFFMQRISVDSWRNKSPEEKQKFITQFTDIREGLGFPVLVESGFSDNSDLEILKEEREEIHSGFSVKKVIDHPEEFLDFLEYSIHKFEVLLDEIVLKKKDLERIAPQFFLTAQNSEEFVLFESFIGGKEFSCIVIQEEDGTPLALPPTEIRKVQDVFDYRSKYLPGTSRKITPIEVDEQMIEEIRKRCCALFESIHAHVYARIDGFITEAGDIFLNDPNTTSGMLPSSFFFHQAAEIGLNASHFLTYIIRTSLAERIQSGKRNQEFAEMMHFIDRKIQDLKESPQEKIRVAVIMGGYSTERHISMESGRNIYEKLASSSKYAPFPVFLTGSDEAYNLYVLPIHYMLKDNADDIRDKILLDAQNIQLKGAAMLNKIKEEASPITQKYAGTPLMKPQKIGFEELAEQADVVFIALHGRPGEDGSLQRELEKYGLPYNGSGVESSQITINKYETNEILQKHGIQVAKHTLVHKKDWLENPDKVIAYIEKEFPYPLIAKPADDGCSSAVKKIKNRESLVAFTKMMFREQPPFLAQESEVLQLKANEEFPQKGYFLVEELISRQDAKYFMEITGGLLTHADGTQSLDYEVFEPSETLALGDVLSLEEKFLAGEGQNITPAVYAPEATENTQISVRVREALKKVAQILQIEGYARIDAFVRVSADLKVEVIIIEVNSLPGMTPATCIFHQSAINGYKPYHFIDAILNFALRKLKN
ncbi:MAG: D-alanine--D-alanine ligase [Microscillaceae bacterium]|nr:D-alanine--D-alanine ligase [Microscillaceae bacterium]